jgi:hypothetical protein
VDPDPRTLQKSLEIQAVMRRFRQLSLGVHPDKNLEDERAQGAFGRLQTAKDDIIRGHEVAQADDGSTVIKPLALNNYGDERMGESLEVLGDMSGIVGVGFFYLGFERCEL